MNDYASDETEFVSYCHGPRRCRVCDSPSYSLTEGEQRCDGCSRVVQSDAGRSLNPGGPPAGRVVLEPELPAAPSDEWDTEAALAEVAAILQEARG